MTGRMVGLVAVVLIIYWRDCLHGCVVVWMVVVAVVCFFVFMCSLVAAVWNLGVVEFLCCSRTIADASSFFLIDVHVFSAGRDHYISNLFSIAARRAHVFIMFSGLGDVCVRALHGVCQVPCLRRCSDVVVL